MRARRVLGVLPGPAIVWLSGARGTSVVWAVYTSTLTSVGPAVHCHPVGAADTGDSVLDVPMHRGLRVHVAGLCPEDAEALVLTVDHRQPPPPRRSRSRAQRPDRPGAAPERCQLPSPTSRCPRSSCAWCPGAASIPWRPTH